MGRLRITGITAGGLVLVVTIAFGIDKALTDRNTTGQGNTALSQTDRSLRLQTTISSENHYRSTIAGLGSSSQTVRTANVHTLEQIVGSTPSRQPEVVDTLCSFIREHAVRGPNDAAPSKESRPQPDVALALKLLAQRDPTKDGEAQIDLSNAYLPGAQLADANLGPVRFGNANLAWADLSRANLQDPNFDPKAAFGTPNRATSFGPAASLTHANMTAARLSLADFAAGANLSGADLTGASLVSVDFQPRVDLSAVTLHGADMKFATVSGDNLSHARLGPDDPYPAPSRADPPELRPTVVTDANFSERNLSGANIHYVDWSTSNISGARLAGVSLRHTDLTHVALDTVNKRGVDLRGINLHGKNDLLIGPDDHLVPLSGLELGGGDNNAGGDKEVIVPPMPLDPEP